MIRKFSKKNKIFLPILLSITMIFSLIVAYADIPEESIPVNALAMEEAGDFQIDGALGVDYTFASHKLTIINSGSYTIKMKETVTQTTSDVIAIADGVTATITISDLNISTTASPLQIGVLKPMHTSAVGVTNVTLKLDGTNTLFCTGTSSSLNVLQAGIYVAEDAELTIEEGTTGNKELIATATTLSAGIGGIWTNMENIYPGKIIINSGKITATGGNGMSNMLGGAGIGGSDRKLPGIVEINGGTIIATGGSRAAGIGGGEGSDGGTIKITGGNITANGTFGGAGIGGGYGIGAGYAGNAGTILIEGGTINATGGVYNTVNGGAGIGGGYTGNGGQITIKGGNITATGNSGGAGIGGGASAAGGTTTISGGMIAANGSLYSTGIGGGYSRSAGTITISDDAFVVAQGGNNAKDIGDGYASTSSVNVVIDNAMVYAMAGKISPAPVNGIGDDIYPVYATSNVGDKLITDSESLLPAGVRTFTTEQKNFAQSASNISGFPDISAVLWVTDDSLGRVNGITFNGDATEYSADVDAVILPYTTNMSSNFIGILDYFIDFMRNDGTETKHSIAVIEKKLPGFDRVIERPADPSTRTGYDFDGWYEKEESGDLSVTPWVFKNEGTPTSVASDTILYAKWIAKNLSVTFSSNGGNIPSIGSKTVIYDDAYGDLATVSRVGYNFDGWYTAASAGNKVTSISLVKNELIHTLFAHWAAKNVVVSFDSNNGGIPSVLSKAIAYDSPYGSLAIVSRSGYTFDGWFTEAQGGNRITSSSVLDNENNHTLYAHWNAINVVTPEDPDDPVTPENPGTTPTDVIPREIEPEEAAPQSTLSQEIRDTLSPAAQAKIEAQTGNLVRDLIDGNVPLGGFGARGVWSLLNMILALISLVSLCIMLISIFRKKEYQAMARLLQIASAAMAAVTVIVWVILDKLHVPTVWIDQYTATIAALFIVTAIVTVVFNLTKKNAASAKAELEA
jgi:uncharacterized repeat protein (TIGR02543 family)